MISWRAVPIINGACQLVVIDELLILRTSVLAAPGPPVDPDGVFDLRHAIRDVERDISRSPMDRQEAVGKFRELAKGCCCAVDRTQRPKALGDVSRILHAVQPHEVAPTTTMPLAWDFSPAEAAEHHAGNASSALRFDGPFDGCVLAAAHLVYGAAELQRAK